jgi:ABC-type transporter Mla maintaining outer membrane lipid asymmetry permease subunit MlaE
MLTFPIGTIIGMALNVYLRRITAEMALVEAMKSNDPPTS